MMCARLRYASRGLFVGTPRKLSRQLARCLPFRDSGGFENTSSIFENTVTSKFSCEALRHTAFSRVALVPDVRNEVLGQLMLRDVDLGRAHQVHVPLVEVVQCLQAREINRNDHVEQESQTPSLVKDLFADTLKTHCTRMYCASVILHV